jgi:cell division protein FtsI (penicillin-binding protein 3)
MAKTTVRLRVVEVAFAIGAAAIVARAAQVQLVHGERYRATAEAQRTRGRVTEAARGTIYDRNGLVVAGTREEYWIGVARDQLRDVGKDLPAIAKALGIGRRSIQRRFRGQWAHLDGPFTATQIESVRDMPGVHLNPRLERFHPNPDFARAVIGRPPLKGRPASGLEAVMDSLLTGTPGYSVYIRDRRGVEYESPSRLDAFPVPGYDVYLTLDADLQEIVQQALDDAVDRLDAAGGDVLVLDPITGEILAAASRSRGSQSTATALTSVFEPGSTAKIFAAAALLQHDLATSSDLFYAEQGIYRLGSRTIRDEHAEGWLTLQQIVERSSNIGIVKAIQALSAEHQFAMLRDFGLGSPTGVEFPSEAGGILRLPYRWSGTTAASLAIGYEVAVTPLQLAAAYAAIANDGLLLRPTFVREIRAPNERVVYRHVPEPVRRVVSPAVAAQLREMLRGVVYRGGTGSTAALASFEVAGKTGTARRAGPSGYIPGSHTSTFASMFPADDPQLVMVVKLDDPRGAYARLTAAPVTRAVLEQVLAARSDALDRTRLAMGRSEGTPAPAVGGGTVPYVSPWPVTVATREQGSRTVPDIRGLSLREAFQTLHAAGLRGKLEGWGRVATTTPRAGKRVEAGDLITIVGTEERPSP